MRGNFYDSIRQVGGRHFIFPSEKEKESLLDCGVSGRKYIKKYLNVLTGYAPVLHLNPEETKNRNDGRIFISDYSTTSNPVCHPFYFSFLLFFPFLFFPFFLFRILSIFLVPKGRAQLWNRILLKNSTSFIVCRKNCRYRFNEIPRVPDPSINYAA